MTGDSARYGGEPVREEILGYGSQDISPREKEAAVEALESEYISRGPTVDAFEADVAEYVGVDHAIATSSGTAALHLLGRALFGEGDEVITTPFTFVATATAASHAGAEPVFADVDPETRNLDPDAVREKITSDTTGLIPVHYAGHPCEVDELLDIAEAHDLEVIWDASHAIGSEYDGELVGAQAGATVFSFHPVKTITTCEGGMVVTDDAELAESVRRLRSFCMNYDPEGHEDEPWYQVAEGLGYNYNVSDVHAAVGRVQLERLGEFVRRRREIFERYGEAFTEIPGVEPPTVRSYANPAWHLYTVEITEGFGCSREEFVNAMHEENVGVQVHYVPLHHHPYFREEYGYEPGEFPATEAVYERIVSLPLFPAMTEGDVEDVVEAVTKISTYHR